MGIDGMESRYAGAATFSVTGRELFRVNMVYGIHGVQEINFNPHSKPGDEDYGLLYIYRCWRGWLC